MPRKTIIVLALMVVASTTGDILVAKGMKQVGEITSFDVHELLRVVAQAARNPVLITGIAVQALYFVCFTTALSFGALSSSMNSGRVPFALARASIISGSLGSVRSGGNSGRDANQRTRSHAPSTTRMTTPMRGSIG